MELSESISDLKYSDRRYQADVSSGCIKQQRYQGEKCLLPHLKALISSCFGTGGEGFDSKAKICDGLFQKSVFQVYLNRSKLEILKSHYTVCFLFSSFHTK